MTRSIAGPQPEAAEAIRAACIRAAVEAYEQARADGLCAEGAWEAAVAAMRSLDLGAAAGAPEAGGRQR